jgi:hypothetical protein
MRRSAPLSELASLHALFWLTCTGRRPVRKLDLVGEQYLTELSMPHRQRPEQK